MYVNNIWKKYRDSLLVKRLKEDKFNNGQILLILNIINNICKDCNKSIKEE